MGTKIREVGKLRSNCSTTNEMKREMLISRVPSKDCAISDGEYIIIATNEVVKRARLRGKHHNKQRCRAIHARSFEDLLQAHDLQGCGMEIDRVQAYKWFNLAAAQGHRHAASLREIVAIEMTRDQIIQAQRLALEQSRAQ
jgi:hypothetical protein